MSARAFFRRSPWERVSTALIALGLVMLMQPWSIDVFSYAFDVLLAGVVGYSIASKLPQRGMESQRSLPSLPREGAPASLRRFGGG